jgi:16S rRNA (uracil1498-N3)-methyltransferase
MPRFFAEITHFPVAVIHDLPSVHHISGPLRKRKGDEIDIRDMLKGYRARIVSIESRQIVLEILTEQDLMDRFSATIHLGMCLFDLKDMEDAVRYSTELGVSSIHPVVSERSNIRSISESRYKRWQAIVLEAVKQCERKSIPVLHRVESLEKFIHSTCRSWGVRLVAIQDANEFISAYKEQDMGVLIGPEGGFTSKELDMILPEGFIPISLGNTTLRAVTASIAALSILGL